jgi:cell wall-associated NlpC family hydrolase
VRIAIAPVLAAALAVALIPQSGHAALNPTLEQVAAQLAVLNTQAEVAQEKLNQTQVEVASAQRSLAQANSRVASSRAQVTLAQIEVGRLASAAYRSGGLDPSLELLLADNSSQFLEQLSALDTVTRHQGDVVRAATVAKQRLDQDQLAVTQQLAALRTLYAAATTAYAQVKAAQDKEAALLNSLEAAQRAALAKAQAQARATAKADAAAAIAQAQAAEKARLSAEAAAARARSKARPRPSISHRAHRPTGGSTGGSSGSSSSGSIGQRVVAYALAKVGDAYVWGGAGPSAFDCSGLTMRAYQVVGVSLPHSAAAQFSSGRRIAARDLRPGDLVFYYSPIHHVGIYIGGGMIVNAENPGVGVTVAPLYSMPYSGAVRPY